MTFAEVRAKRHMAFMPFVTAGDPDLSTTQRLIRRLAGAGVDLIEVGFPYSDPIADGPVIQASYTRALKSGVTAHAIFEAIASLDLTSVPPLVAMVSYAIVLRHGVDSFAHEAKSAGFSGLIIPDLPGDEAADCFEIIRRTGLDLVQLIAPTTPRERVPTILKHCSGFVYCLAVAGITGERAQVARELLDQLQWLRQETDLPLAVGFGISKPEHVAPLRKLADGVIVGSAIVRHLQQVADGESDIDSMLSAVGELAHSMVSAVRS